MNEGQVAEESQVTVRNEISGILFFSPKRRFQQAMLILFGRKLLLGGKG